MKRRLMNRGETQLHQEIRDAALGFGADIFRKVRIADVVDIDRLSRRELSKYGLMAHFDVLVATPEGLPAFAIEYDGGGHDPSKDDLKDAIAREADLALFRVDEKLLDRPRAVSTTQSRWSGC